MNKITELLMGSILLAASSCALESEVYDKISPDNSFYLDTAWHGLTITLLKRVITV